jgi:hypothetical protein
MDATPDELSWARHVMVQRGLSAEQMRTVEGQSAILNAVAQYRTAPGTRQSDMRGEASRAAAARATGGTGVALDPRLDARVGRDAFKTFNDVYDNLISPFGTAVSALGQARAAGASEAELRAVLDAVRGGSIGQLTGMSPTLQRFASAVGRTRQLVGREWSGAAIGADEWRDFQQVLGMPNVFTSLETYERVMNDLLGSGRVVLDGADARFGGVEDVTYRSEWERARRERARQRGAGR